jgi:addiction module HigA family antidote
MSGLRTITDGDDDRLANVHPGDILRGDFLIGSEIPVSEVATGTGINAGRLQSILDGEMPIDADINLRLARYFGMSERFFLGLQSHYDLEEAKRAYSAELDGIIPRAA